MRLEDGHEGPQTEKLDPFIPEIFRSPEKRGQFEKTPEEMGLAPANRTELTEGDQVYLRRNTGAGGNSSRMYYPCTVVDQDGQTALSTNTDLPSWPPGYGQPHMPGTILRLDEGTLAELFIKTDQ